MDLEELDNPLVLAVTIMAQLLEAHKRQIKTLEAEVENLRKEVFGCVTTAKSTSKKTSGSKKSLEALEDTKTALKTD
jgi:hypothetical protein